MDRLKMNGIFFRLVSSFLLILLPMVAAGMILLSWTRTEIQNQLEENASANVDFLMQNLENEIWNIRSLVYGLPNDRTLQSLMNRYATAPTYEYYSMVSDVQYRLQTMQLSNTYIDDITLHIPEVGYSISVVKGYQPLDEEALARMLAIPDVDSPPFLADDAGLFIMKAFGFSGAGNQPRYLMRIDLSRAMLNSFLSKFSQSTESSTALHDHSSGQWLFSTGTGAQFSELAQQEGIDILAPGGRSQSVRTIDGRQYYVLTHASGALDFSLTQYVPLGDIYQKLDKFKYLWPGYIVFCLLIMVLYAFSIHRQVRTPVQKLVAAFQQLEQGDMSTRLEYKAASEFNYLYEEFNIMVDCLDRMVYREFEQRIYAKTMELRQLQAQIKPHFLYNSYFLLHRLILDEDFEGSARLSEALGTYFQYITRDASDESLLQQEMQHAVSYASIQLMRFGEWTDSYFAPFPESFRHVVVPRLTLQPVMENAIEHGIDRGAKSSALRLTYQQLEKGVAVVIEDSGNGLTDQAIEALQRRLDAPSGPENATGLFNVHRRLQLRYGSRAGVWVARSALGGLRVEVRITPLPEEGDNV